MLTRIVAEKADKTAVKKIRAAAFSDVARVNPAKNGVEVDGGGVADRWS